MDLSFGAALLIFGALLTVVAALSGVMRGTVLSASVLSVGLGIFLAAVGVVHVDPAEQFFMAWFGPKGVASMLFALLVLKSTVGDGGLIFDIASIAIVASIAAHGLTDTIGAAWVGERVRRRNP